MAVKKKQILTMFLLAFNLAACSPYSNQFSCPGTYDGICESPKDAYNDSVAGIDPRKLDPKWQEKKRKWAEKHKALVEARKRVLGGNSTGEAPDYREALFQRIKAQLEEGTPPEIAPPRIGRALVLGYQDGKVFVPPHYVYFMLDRPRWILKKLPERTQSSINYDSVLHAVAEKKEMKAVDEPKPAIP